MSRWNSESMLRIPLSNSVQAPKASINMHISTHTHTHKSIAIGMVPYTCDKCISASGLKCMLKI